MSSVESPQASRGTEESKSLELTLRIPRISLGRRTGPDRAQRSNPERLKKLIIGFALLAVLAATGDVFLFVKARDASATDKARDEATVAVGTRVPAMFSYTSQTLEQDLEKAVAQTTGSFRNDYSSVLDSVVRPAASGKQVATTAKVDASSVISAKPDKVVVLVYLTQSTTNGSQSPTVTGSRLRVTLSETKHGWLISDLKTV